MSKFKTDDYIWFCEESVFMRYQIECVMNYGGNPEYIKYKLFNPMIKGFEMVINETSIDDDLSDQWFSKYDDALAQFKRYGELGVK
jgi:hypothetical protein